MRIRRLSYFFWATCIVAFMFILYVVTDLSFKLPSIKPAMVELDDNKWTAFEIKLQKIEKELSQHHAVVGEIKHAMDQLMEQSQEFRPPQKRQHSNENKIKEFKVVGDEPPRMHKKMDMTCPAIQTSSKTDIQMLSMYDRIMFDDVNGGVWKQGWNIEYKESQWSSKNKLKVFIVPHSHNDPGWIKTFENYYKTQTRAIFTNMVEKLNEGVGRKFIWAEVSFLALWWATDATDKEKLAFQKLLKSGQIEIVTGGWVMNDEANSHWLSIVQQLTTGHQWLIDNLGYIPKNHWSIDPFGYSSTQPYLLKLSGLENSVIQRVHYRVKKELALNRQLEFKWRQLWDGVGKTDVFTHMMPFYSYDIPHTCGPDPKICCQFDFKRLPGNGVTCPWDAPPRKIIQKNVNERAFMILDQWRKKAQLYRSNVLLVPLGDDFRYDRANEWDNQYTNYEMLISHINENDSWNAEVQFGTLEDYFKAVHEEVKLADFPVLSGDFFTYADRNQHYWSGYYTSRAFYKRMDRALLAYVRAAETITTQAFLSSSVSQLVGLQLEEQLDSARKTLALFQHHDGVTGTSRDEVREDYSKKLLKAIKHCQSAIQQAAYYLLKQPTIKDQTQEDVFFEVDDVWRRHDELPSRITITLDILSPSRRIVLYNSLAFRRYEVLTLIVSSPHVEVFEEDGSPLMSQISPVVAGEKRLGFAANKFELSFPVSVGPLGLAVYTVALRDSASINKYTSYSHVCIYNADYWSAELPRVFVVEQPAGRLATDVSLRSERHTLVLNELGLPRALLRDGRPTPLHMDFMQYDTQKSADNNSGAYLFMPPGPAVDFNADPYPEIVLVEGIHKATAYTGLVGPKEAEIVLAITLYNNPAVAHTELEIVNSFQLDPAADDIELSLRLATEIRNGDTFYTDLNGMQMIRRRYFDKLPLQANFYPLPSAAFIEDENTRLTVLTSAPLGTAALVPGQIEIMQDRRLSRDDNRGMNQGVLDNVRTRHVMKLVLEHASAACKSKPADRTSAHLSLGAHVAQQMLLQPTVVLQYAGERRAPPRAARAGAADLELAAVRPRASGMRGATKLQGVGLTFRRAHLDTCYGNETAVSWYRVGDGQFSLDDLLGVQRGRALDSSLTFVHVRQPLPDGVLTLCPMEVRSVFVNQTLTYA